MSLHLTRTKLFLVGIVTVNALSSLPAAGQAVEEVQAAADPDIVTRMSSDTLESLKQVFARIQEEARKDPDSAQLAVNCVESVLGAIKSVSQGLTTEPLGLPRRAINLELERIKGVSLEAINSALQPATIGKLVEVREATEKAVAKLALVSSSVIFTPNIVWDGKIPSMTFSATKEGATEDNAKIPGFPEMHLDLRTCKFFSPTPTDVTSTGAGEPKLADLFTAQALERMRDEFSISTLRDNVLDLKAQASEEARRSKVYDEVGQKARSIANMLGVVPVSETSYGLSGKDSAGEGEGHTAIIPASATAK